MRRAARSAAAAAVDLRAGWREARYCAIDVETTGLDLRRDSIISIGSVGIHDGRVVCSDNYYSLIRPACPVSVASMRIHCLRPADLENAPGARDVGQEIARQLAGRIVVAHAAWIERAFLSRLLRQVGVRFAAPVIDTAALARAGLRPGQPARPRAIPRTASTATLIAGLRTAPRARRRGHDCGGVPRHGHQSREAWQASRLKAGIRAVPGCPIRQEHLLKSEELTMAGDHARLRRGKRYQEEQAPASYSCQFGRHHGGRSRYIRAAASRRASRAVIGARRNGGRPSHSGGLTSGLLPGFSRQAFPYHLRAD